MRAGACLDALHLVVHHAIDHHRAEVLLEGEVAEAVDAMHHVMHHVMHYVMHYVMHFVMQRLASAGRHGEVLEAFDALQAEGLCIACILYSAV